MIYDVHIVHVQYHNITIDGLDRVRVLFNIKTMKLYIYIIFVYEPLDDWKIVVIHKTDNRTHTLQNISYDIMDIDILQLKTSNSRFTFPNSFKNILFYYCLICS